MTNHLSRRAFIGGSDARIIMGDDEAALLRLWREKRGEVEPEDLSANLIVQLGVVTEPLNRTLVRAQYRPSRQRRPTSGPTPGEQMDGGNPGRHGRGYRRGVRGQIHAAVVVLGRSGGRKTHGPAPAQHVGDQCQSGGALHHHRRRQMGRDLNPGRLPLPTSAADRGKEILALRGEWRAPSPLWRSNHHGRGLQRSASSI